MWGSRTWTRLFNNRTAPAPPNVNSDFENHNRSSETRLGNPHPTKNDTMEGEDLQFVEIVPFDKYDLLKVSPSVLLSFYCSYYR